MKGLSIVYQLVDLLYTPNDKGSLLTVLTTDTYDLSTQPDLEKKRYMYIKMLKFCKFDKRGQSVVSPLP